MINILADGNIICFDYRIIFVCFLPSLMWMFFLLLHFFFSYIKSKDTPESPYTDNPFDEMFGLGKDKPDSFSSRNRK